MGTCVPWSLPLPMPPPALAADDLSGYLKGLPALRSALAAYLAGYPPAARGELATFSGKLPDAPDLDAARRQFEPFSTAVADLARAEQVQQREQVWIYQCPMSPVLGTARWLSRTHAVAQSILWFGHAGVRGRGEVSKRLVLVTPRPGVTGKPEGHTTRHDRPRHPLVPA